MAVSLDLLMNAVVSGLLLGGFYAAVTLGVSLIFGHARHRQHRASGLHHPRLLRRLHVNTAFGLDPILAGLLFMLPLFYLLGAVRLSRLLRGASSDAARSRCSGLVVLLRPAVHHRGQRSSLIFGVDYRLVQAPYIGADLTLGRVDLPLACWCRSWSRSP